MQAVKPQENACNVNQRSGAYSLKILSFSLVIFLAEICLSQINLPCHALRGNSSTPVYFLVCIVTDKSNILLFFSITFALL